MNERSEMIEWIRGEIVGPTRILKEPLVVDFVDSEFRHDAQWPNGPIVWKPGPEDDLQEVLYFDQESPFRKYGTGLLYPDFVDNNLSEGEKTLEKSDTVGVEQGIEGRPQNEYTDNEEISDDASEKVHTTTYDDDAEDTDDFEIINPDLKFRSTIGVSFCANLKDEGEILIELPQKRKFFWQEKNSDDFQLNGYYQNGHRIWSDENGREFKYRIWRRRSAACDNSKVRFNLKEFYGNNPKRTIELSEDCPISLMVQIFPRKMEGKNNKWIFTVVLKNTTNISHEEDSRVALFQSFFKIGIVEGNFIEYPESQRSIQDLDLSEQSLSMLYQESPIWATGHGCSAGWDSELNEEPLSIYADDLPAVELPSMTPDIKINGKPVRFSMRELASLSDDGNGTGWESLENLCMGYDEWIKLKEKEALDLPEKFHNVAKRHFEECRLCLKRITEGINLLRTNENIRRAFRLANISMLLQQIATKQIKKRSLIWNDNKNLHVPESDYISPWEIFNTNSENSNTIGGWRAFQIAFLLMSIKGVTDKDSDEREMVDLIWFPTGGGKTEAYLAVMAFYMFHERFQIKESGDEVRRDGTNILMRYTLRMLTTQQFERAASLICAMEFLRRHTDLHKQSSIKGDRFSLGLWIGGSATPNNIKASTRQIKEFKEGTIEGNPLVLTDCPWCRAKIGRFKRFRKTFLRGINEDKTEGPLLLCPDSSCDFGSDNRDLSIPVEVIDERIYKYPPSVIISTADKLALLAYRPNAGSLFGRKFINNSEYNQIFRPPQLIIQDELHLISGPLGTMYAVYEGIIESLCSEINDNIVTKPKIIASTATIRNAEEQVRSVYARSSTKLFPSPALKMEDSFFGKYSREEDGRLSKGRIYLGINANNYNSLQTTQVRAFSAALFRPYKFDSDEKADPWWTLLAFYNSIRELGGGKTLFDSDIKSRLKFLFNREGFPIKERRHLVNVNELTSRLPQTGIKSMMDRLSVTYNSQVPEAIDACLASNIIEVGVDIDRLSLMGVVGQPKSSSTYIQVTGRVGRRWWERPGLVLMLYSPSKSRDVSHFEQFHSYHRRLYEFVEPTSATPFAISAIKRGLAGALLSWARQFCNEEVKKWDAYESHINSGFKILEDRAREILTPEDFQRSLKEMEIEKKLLDKKWKMNPQKWEEFPQQADGEYLMLWPGQFCLPIQKDHGVTVPSSMRQVDMEGEIEITKGYAYLGHEQNFDSTTEDN